MKIFITITLILACATAQAEVYKCTADGKTVYQQVPCEGSAGTVGDTVKERAIRQIKSQPPLVAPKEATASQQPTLKNKQTVNRYEGGSLHKATGKNWRQASASDRLETAADFAAAILKGRFSSMTELNAYAIEMMTCITEATTGGAGDDYPVSTLGATCAILLGWNQ